MAIIDCVLEALDQLEIENRGISDERNQVKFLMELEDGGTLETFIDINEEPDLVRVYTYLDGQVPELKRTEVVLLLNQANLCHLLQRGNLESPEGLVRYRASILWAGTEPNAEMISPLISDSLQMMALFRQGVEKIVHAGMSAGEAFAVCWNAAFPREEGDDSSDDSALDEV
jgi:hypothetical protein